MSRTSAPGSRYPFYPANTSSSAFYRRGLLRKLQHRWARKRKSSMLTRIKVTQSPSAGKTYAQLRTTTRCSGTSYPWKNFNCVGRQDLLGLCFHTHLTNRTVLSKGPQRSPLPHAEDTAGTRAPEASPSGWAGRLPPALGRTPLPSPGGRSAAWPQASTASLQLFF